MCNALAIFLRQITLVLGLFIGKGVLVYFDDVLIYFEMPKQLIEIFDNVLRLLAYIGLTCKATNCSIFIKFVYYFNNVMFKDGIYFKPDRLKKIKKTSQTKNRHRLLPCSLAFAITTII